MDGFDVFRNIAFGTSFDPTPTHRRKNKLKNYKKNKRQKYEEALNQQDEFVVKERCITPTESSDSTESSDDEVSTQPAKSTCGNPRLAAKRSKKRLSIMQLFRIRKEEVAHFRRTHKIYVTGDDIPDPLESFGQLESDYNVSSTVLKNIQELGYAEPTPIQMQAMPLMLQHRQILSCAPTGSGKTAAFLIPLIHSLKEPKKGGVRAVILAPTRELAKQIHSFCVRLSNGTGLRSLVIESADKVKERPKLFQKHDILISTPNRLIYLLKNDPPAISLDKVQWLVVDECDKLFEAGAGDTGFREQLAFVYNACDSAGLRRAMFSATYTHQVEEWCKLNLDSLACVAIGTKNTAVESVKQELLFTGSEDGKLLALRNFVQEGFMTPCLVFVQSKERAKDLLREVSCLCPGRTEVMHADLGQEKRDEVVEHFIKGKVWVLICTELMGRGIDFKGVNVVINYDFPPTAISYIHRIGRTGRAGEEGRAITYFTTDDVKNLKNIAQVIKNAGCKVPDYIMKLKSKRKKNEFVRPIKRKKISTVPKYDLDKQSKKRQMILNSKKHKKEERK